MRTHSILSALTGLMLSLGVEAGQKPLTFDELMKFNTIHDASISDDGSWVVYQLRPDRGDGVAVIRAVDGTTEHRVAQGASPKLSSDSKWAAMVIEPTLEERKPRRKKTRSSTTGWP